MRSPSGLDPPRRLLASVALGWGLFLALSGPALADTTSSPATPPPVALLLAAGLVGVIAVYVRLRRR